MRTSRVESRVPCLLFCKTGWPLGVSQGACIQVKTTFARKKPVFLIQADISSTCLLNSTRAFESFVSIQSGAHGEKLWVSKNKKSKEKIDGALTSSAISALSNNTTSTSYRISDICPHVFLAWSLFTLKPRCR